MELAFIRLTKPEMEQSMDAVLERLERLERQIDVYKRQLQSWKIQRSSDTSRKQRM